MALVIIPRLTRYYGCLSIAEVMGKMYGVYARKVVGVSAFVFCLGILGAQIKAYYWVMESLFFDNALFVTIITLSIIILYSSIGGVYSVIKTDVLQFFIFIVIVPLIASYIIKTSGGITQITSVFSKSCRGFFYGGSITAFVSLAIFYVLPDLAPDTFHRLLIGRNCQKNQAAIYVLAFVNLVTLIFVGCVAFIAISLTNTIDLKSQNTLFFVIENLIASKWVIVFF